MNRTVLLLLCAAVAGCAQDRPRYSDTNARIAADCRVEADRVYDAQHRGDLFRPISTSNTPSSGAYAPGGDTQQLSAMFARDRLVDNCVRRGGVERPSATESAPPPR